MAKKFYDGTSLSTSNQYANMPQEVVHKSYSKQVLGGGDYSYVDTEEGINKLHAENSRKIKRMK